MILRVFFKLLWVFCNIFIDWRPDSWHYIRKHPFGAIRKGYLTGEYSSEFFSERWFRFLKWHLVLHESIYESFLFIRKRGSRLMSGKLAYRTKY